MQHLTYWEETRTPLYSFIFALPLLLAYEVGVVAISAGDVFILRNGADVLMRQILGLLGIYGVYAFSGAFLVGFLVAFLRQKKRLRSTQVRGEYLLKMFLESLVWGTGLFLILIAAQPLLQQPGGATLIHQVVLSIGAGIYEEFVFRVVLITGLGVILGFVFQWKRTAQRVGAIILAAVLFSLFHFIGEYGDPPGLSLFLLRFLAGLFLGLVYALRGFGITAYTHSVYNLIVLVRSTAG